MRIDQNLTSQRAGDNHEAATSRARGGQAAAQTGERPAATAQLSIDQGWVRSLAAQVNAQPEVRQERVAVLGKAVRDGSYQVLPQQTAGAVFSEMRMHPGSR